MRKVVRRAARSQRGYTLIEVMMSLSVLGIGAMGIVALQKTTAFGNADARNLATASEIAATWAERLRADGAAWTNTPTGNSLDQTTWLLQAGTANPVGPPTAWFEPIEVQDRGSPAADLLGSDIYAGDTDASGSPLAVAFCTQIRLTRVYPTLIRAEIRVFWDRDYDPVECPDDPADVTARFGEYGFVYVSTAIPQSSIPL